MSAPVASPTGLAPVDDLAATPLTRLKGVGPSLRDRLARLGIETLQDLLLHLPLRYEDRTRITPMASVRGGEPVQVEGVVEATRIEQGRRRSLLVTLRDEGGQLGLRFYAFNTAQRERFQVGRRFRCFGEVRPGRSGLEMYHPETQVVDPGVHTPPAAQLTPVYPVTEGIPQRRMQTLIDQALEQLRGRPLPELLPELQRSPWHLPGLNESLHHLHHPGTQEDPARFRARLVFEELLAHHLGMRRLRQQLQRQVAHPCHLSASLSEAFRSRLSFRLTEAQERVFSEIARDLSTPLPMLRLVQGDVGSGKTVVAALAALAAIDSGHQCALMAPTEILAEQHYQNFRRWFEPLGHAVAWVSGRQKAAERRQALAALASGEARVAVGTHALFQDGVQFQRLALLIVDEQHRFGVHQRLALQAKGVSGGVAPHQLVMTATPIPRTLAMSAFADLDTSIIDALPPGRSPVVTLAIPDSRREEVITRIARVCGEGRQVYWVCTLIEESEALQCQAAEVTAQTLQALLPGQRIGLVHGRQSQRERGEIMAAFKAHQIEVLVATTVIEVGVDVPNATLIVIENPERLGLAQLHQLRGRVGRGAAQSYCVLLYRPPLSRTARARLQVLRDSQDGFVIAERDLELRGPGELLGTRQTGLAQFRIADLQRDAAWLPPVRDLAPALLEDPERAEALIRRWLGQRLHYARV